MILKTMKLLCSSRTAILSIHTEIYTEKDPDWPFCSREVEFFRVLRIQGSDPYLTWDEWDEIRRTKINGQYLTIDDAAMSSEMRNDVSYP